MELKFRDCPFNCKESKMNETKSGLGLGEGKAGVSVPFLVSRIYKGGQHMVPQSNSDQLPVESQTSLQKSRETTLK